MTSVDLYYFDLFNPTAEHEFLRKTVRDFVAKEVEPQALEHDRNEKFNLTLFRKLGSLGLLGISVPTEFGGSGMDPLATVIAHEELSASDPGFCLAYLAHALLCVNNLAVNGSDQQRHRYLPDLCSGKLIGAMAISEPGAGTDVRSMQTMARLQGEHYLINGRKMWITNGTIDEGQQACDVLWLYAKTGEKISTLIVEKSAQGFYVGQKIVGKCGMRASNTAELCFDNCSVPRENLVGQEGESLLHMMRNLEIERLGLAAMGIGIARRAIEVMLRYANEREAFKQKLVNFGQIQSHIADSFAEYRAARSYVYDVARRISFSSEGHRLDSDGVKLVAATAAKNIADRAIQVLGGYGYVSEYVVERLWRDAKLLEIGGGTVEAHQKNISHDLSKEPQRSLG